MLEPFRSSFVFRSTSLSYSVESSSHFWDNSVMDLKWTAHKKHKISIYTTNKHTAGRLLCGRII